MTTSTTPTTAAAQATVSRKSYETHSDILATKALLYDMAFSTAVDPSLASLLALRPHCITVIANQAVYVSILVAEIKAAAFGLLSSLHQQQLQAATMEAAGVSTSTTKKTATTRNSNNSKGTPLPPKVFRHVVKPLASMASPLQVNITVVGCGQVGRRVVDCLVASGCFHPSSISVVTRQVDGFDRYRQMGIRCQHAFDEATLPSVDAFLLCCQPSQLNAVARSLKGKIRNSAVVFSVLCGVPAEKVITELAHPLCITTGVDVDGISRVVASWTREDEVLLRCERRMYAASKTFEQAADELAPEERRIVAVPPEERRALRKGDVMDQTFPLHASDHYGRLLYVLVQSCMHRGLSFPDALYLAVLHLLPAGVRENHETVDFDFLINTQLHHQQPQQQQQQQQQVPSLSASGTGSAQPSPVAGMHIHHHHRGVSDGNASASEGEAKGGDAFNDAAAAGAASGAMTPHERALKACSLPFVSKAFQMEVKDLVKALKQRLREILDAAAAA